MSKYQDIDVAAATANRAAFDAQSPIDHAYLDPGDTHAADGDTCYSGCFICGKSRMEHTR